MRITAARAMLRRLLAKPIGSLLLSNIDFPQFPDPLPKKEHTAPHIRQNVTAVTICR